MCKITNIDSNHNHNVYVAANISKKDVYNALQTFADTGKT